MNMRDERDAGRFEWMASNPGEASQALNEAYVDWCGAWRTHPSVDLDFGDILRDYVDTYRDPSSMAACRLRKRLADERAR